MKIKVQKAKFIRNIIIGIIALFIVAFIINIAPGYKRNKYKDVINLVIGDENVTEKLIKPVYKDENDKIYIAKEDVQQFLDKTIYFDKEENMVILTSEVSVTGMKIDEKVMNIDGNEQSTLDSIVYKNNVIYIPIEEMKVIYNIEANYLKDENVVIIDKRNKGMIKAEAKEDAKIRFKQRGLSKEVGKLETGDIVSAFYTTSKGWRLIRTETGIVGYVKANVLTNEYILRQDMNQQIDTKNISVNVENGSKTEIDGKKIEIKDLLSLTEEGILLKNVDIKNNDENSEIWANLSIKDVDLSNFNDRTKTIKNITNIAMKNNIKGINVVLTNNNEDIERLVIELAPRLREIGITTNIIENEDINNENYKDIVNYIITK